MRQHFALDALVTCNALDVRYPGTTLPPLYQAPGLNRFSYANVRRSDFVTSAVK